jgi:hypothetical protein
MSKGAAKNVQEEGVAENVYVQVSNNLAEKTTSRL